jgi:serine/threonine-protein kinase
MAPEQMMGEGLDERADLYAVGVIGHVLLTGSVPFANFREKMFNPAPSIRERRPEVPEALESALCRALAADPVHRFTSAQEMREALGAVLGARRATPRAMPAATSLVKPIVVIDQAGTTLASCTNALVVPGGAWLCTGGATPSCEAQVLLSLPGHEGFVPARVVSSALFPAHVKAALPRGFLVEFSRLETGARAALAALAPK